MVISDVCILSFYLHGGTSFWDLFSCYWCTLRSHFSTSPVAGLCTDHLVHYLCICGCHRISKTTMMRRHLRPRCFSIALLTTAEVLATSTGSAVVPPGGESHGCASLAYCDLHHGHDQPTLRSLQNSLKCPPRNMSPNMRGVFMVRMLAKLWDTAV